MICHGQLPAGSFAELRHIDLYNCNRLENVFSESIARGLVQLEKLRINNGYMMEEIVVMERENEEVPSKITFPKLREIRFYKLPRLVSFCKKMGEIEFPQLSTLDLQRLPKLRSLYPSSVGSEGSHECECDDSASTQHLLNQKIKSVNELRFIREERCKKLVNVFSSYSIHSLSNVEEVNISKCDSVELVFDFVGVNIEEGHAGVPLSRLKKLRLSDLPKLIGVWKELPKRIHECQNLQSLKIEKCSKLKNIFSPSMTKIAEQLHELYISECAMMIEIVVAEDKGDEKATDKIEFLQLRHFYLSRLPNLLGFFPKDVESAEIRLFDGKVSFPSLEELSASNVGNFSEIRCTLLPSCSFCQLRVLKVYDCDKILHVAPFNLLQRLHNLEEVHVVSCNSVKEVFEFKGPSVEEGYAVILLSRLKYMTLRSLPKLMQIGKKGHIRSIGFQNLKRLNVKDCGSLRNLFDPSMTRGLLQLEKLWIIKCVKMEEIVAKGEEQEGRMDKIVIPQLKQLRLVRLQKLTSFCQDLYAFDLPLLEYVTVEDCPNMKTFSSGFASTPKLKTMRIAEKHSQEEDLVGDLNNTIQQLFQTQVSRDGGDHGSSTPTIISALL